MGGVDPAAFAELLCGYCLEVGERQQVLVRSTTAAAPLLLALQRAILERDAWPLLRVELPGQTAAFYEHAHDLQLDEAPRTALDEARRIDASLGIQAPTEPYELAGVDPARIARLARARRDVREQTMRKRWCSTLWPAPAAAERAGLGLEEFEAFVARALFLDQPDPVAAWGGLARFQDRLIERLGRARELRVESDGTDLRLRVDGRRWVNSDGRRNMPSGEVFTGPREQSAEGTIRFDVPSGPAGRDVRGVRLTFRAGEVVQAPPTRARSTSGRRWPPTTARAGSARSASAPTSASTRPIGAILFDEKIGGTVHVALGRSYPETGGRNASALHWDLICDLRGGGRLSADGETIAQDGSFAVS